MLTRCFDFISLKKGTAARRCIRHNNLIGVATFICDWKSRVTTSTSISFPKQITLLRFLQCILESLYVCWRSPLLLFCWPCFLRFITRRILAGNICPFWWSMFTFRTNKSRWTCFLFTLTNTKQQFIRIGLHLKWHNSNWKQTTLTTHLYANIYALQKVG